ncbi:hypothetical protein EHQ52_17045 [Leptospira koniambonensis]|uniref:Uncharacterized protein n=1 Tax=Leptospira koniambonensis TaxID=2484950 RepID=A0A4R9J3N0_9LEPT|nr:hypothetical protein EHQ52_17045 [Leptospira koniambonensis]
MVHRVLAILLPNYRCFRSARRSLTRLTRSGCATFCIVTSFAKQTRSNAKRRNTLVVKRHFGN